MDVIQIDGKKWSIDLDWNILPDESQVRREIKDTATRENCDYGLFFNHDGISVLGLSRKFSKAPVAAFYLALANQEITVKSSSDQFADWIVIEKISQDNYWIAVIKNGIPAPSYDKIFNFESLRKKVSELLDNDTYKIFSKDAQVQDMLGGYKEVIGRGLNELTEQVKTKIKLKKIRGLTPLMMYSGLAIILAGVLAIAFFTLKDKYNMMQKQKKFIQEQMAKQQLAEENYRKELKKYDEVIKGKKQEAFQMIFSSLSAHPQELLIYWNRAIGNVKMGNHGWDLKIIKCVYKKEEKELNLRTSCELELTKTTYSTYNMIKDFYKNVKIKGSNATVELPLNINDYSFLNAKDHSILKEIPDKKMLENNVSLFQILSFSGITSSLKEPKELTFPLPPKPLSPAEKASGAKQTNPPPIKMGYAEGELALNGENLLLLESLIKSVNWDGYALSKLDYSVDGKWSVTLKYYIKLSDTPLSYEDPLPPSTPNVDPKKAAENKSDTKSDAKK